MILLQLRDVFETSRDFLMVFNHPNWFYVSLFLQQSFTKIWWFLWDFCGVSLDIFHQGLENFGNSRLRRRRAWMWKCATAPARSYTRCRTATGGLGGPVFSEGQLRRGKTPPNMGFNMVQHGLTWFNMV